MTPMAVSMTTSIKNGRSIGPRESCCSMVRSRLSLGTGRALLSSDYKDIDSNQITVPDSQKRKDAEEG